MPIRIETDLANGLGRLTDEINQLSSEYDITVSTPQKYTININVCGSEVQLIFHSFSSLETSPFEYGGAISILTGGFDVGKLVEEFANWMCEAEGPFRIAQMIEWLRDRIDNYKLPVDATDSNEASKHQINDEIDEDKAQGKDGQSTVQIESTDNASDSDEDSTERKHGDCVICYQPLSKKDTKQCPVWRCEAPFGDEIRDSMNSKLPQIRGGYGPTGQSLAFIPVTPPLNKFSFRRREMEPLSSLLAVDYDVYNPDYISDIFDELRKNAERILKSLDYWRSYEDIQERITDYENEHPAAKGDPSNATDPVKKNDANESEDVANEESCCICWDALSSKSSNWNLYDDLTVSKSFALEEGKSVEYISDIDDTMHMYAKRKMALDEFHLIAAEREVA
ncbi:hypothetical protein PRIPAC_93032 [Pristionchus pacificus]|uniref:Uncharacterized protein n=1 Tax=Pristionchus pacificus TaxID=54126 RepID=A0A2A6BA06_PRIPA|nr:hypothetical protein PRIPAC_93032 [Pristionchus pacificus]|eukprot:PDM62715.1 hypothetical protein PRIPAC_49930 [Pristionchus pacificus]